jgi:DNA polymerase I
MSKTKNKLLIIDGNAVIHRSFHALPPTLRTKNGILVNAIYGFTSFLLKALSEFKPEFVILTLDKIGPTFRHKAYANYKATRTKAADELYEQIPIVKKVAEAFAIPIFEKSGFEADDIIGSLAKQAKIKKDLETIIVTGDLDTLQLIDEKTKVYTMSRGLSESILYSQKEVAERYKLSPKQIIDYKALAGDASDNIPGAKGVGAKTATELLLNFKNIEGVYEAVERKDKKIKPRPLKLLANSKNNVFLSKQLATIDCQVPISLSLEDARFSLPSLDPILELFSRLEFKSLLGKVKSLNDNWQKKSKNEKEIDSEKEKKINEIKKRNYCFLKKEREIENFITELSKQKTISLKVEASQSPANEILGLAFCFQNEKACFIPYRKSLMLKLKPILENEKIRKIGHDLKSSWRILKKEGLTIKGLYFDSLIAAYLLNPGQRHYDLERLAFSELGIDKLTNADIYDKKSVQLSLDLSHDLEKISLYACENVHLVFQLQPILENELKQKKLYLIFQEIEMPLIPILGAMEHRGIKINIDFLNKLEKQVEKKLKVLEKNIYKEAGKKFNINSIKQLKEILFSCLEISTKGIKKTKTGFSTAEDELNKIKDLHPIIPLIQDYRELAKLETTYLKALPKMINPETGRIHTHFNQVITATGRLSSHDPNLQNIPTRTKEGHRIRQAFISEDAYLLVAFDYSQIELRLAAHFSKDQKMISAFRSQSDIHTETAAQINNIKPKEVTEKMRREAKTINFGILYGQGPHGLSQSANISYGQAENFIKKYFATYPNIKKMVDNFINEAKKKGYALTLFGRKRPLPDINSSLPLARKSAERMAMNTPIQGTAADLIKKAMIKIYTVISGKEEEIRLLLQIHDELIFEIKKDKIEDYSPKIKKIMQENVKLKIPIIVKQSSGRNWKELK